MCCGASSSWRESLVGKKVEGEAAGKVYTSSDSSGINLVLDSASIAKQR